MAFKRILQLLQYYVRVYPLSQVRCTDHGGDTGFAHDIPVARNDTAYLTDIFSEFDESNLSLLGNEVNIIKREVDFL